MTSLAYFLLAIALLGTLTSTIFLSSPYWDLSLPLRNEKNPAVACQCELSLGLLAQARHGWKRNSAKTSKVFFAKTIQATKSYLRLTKQTTLRWDVIREVSARYPNVPCQILVTGKPPWPNPPAYCFYRMTELAAHEIMITSDSDVEVAQIIARSRCPAARS